MFDWFGVPRIALAVNCRLKSSHSFSCLPVITVGNDVLGIIKQNALLKKQKNSFGDALDSPRKHTVTGNRLKATQNRDMKAFSFGQGGFSKRP